MTQTAESAQIDEAAPTFLRPPSACGTEFEQVDWTGTLAVRVDDQTNVGIRFNDGRLMDAVAERFGDRVFETEDNVPAYYSVKLNAPTRRRKTPLHYVYLGTRPVVGTRDVSRLVQGLAAQLDRHVEHPTDQYLWYAAPVRTPAGVLLVPSDLMLMGKVVDRVLRPEGFVTADVPHVQVDLETARVVVPEPVLPLDLDAETLAGFPASEPEERLGPGSYPLAGWIVGVSADDAGPLRHAKAVLYGARALRTPFPHGAQTAVDDITRLTKDLPVQGVAWASDEELVQAVLAAGQG